MAFPDRCTPNTGGSTISESTSDIAQALFAAEAQQDADLRKTRQQPLPKSLPLKSRLRPAPSAASTLPLRPPALMVSKLRASTVNSSLGRQSLILPPTHQTRTEGEEIFDKSAITLEEISKK